MKHRRTVLHEFFLGAPLGKATKPPPFNSIWHFCHRKYYFYNEQLMEKSDPLGFFHLMKGLDPVDEMEHAANAEQLLERMNFFRAQAYEAGQSTSEGVTFESLPLVWDSGASFGLTPFRDDFIDYQKCDIPVKDIKSMNRVIGVGTVMHRFVASNGDELFLPAIAYHLETAEIRLFSPQSYHQRWGGHSTLDGEFVVMHLAKQVDAPLRHDIKIPIEVKGSNLPMIYNVACSDKQREEIGPHFRSALTAHTLNFYSPWKLVEDDVEFEFNHLKAVMGSCVTDVTNQNLTRGQKELLLWHWKLGISMQRVQELMKVERAVDREGKHSLMPCVIEPKHPTASTCEIPRCESCEL